MAFYDEKPSILEAVGNGSYLYRFNIVEQPAQDVPRDSDNEHPTTSEEPRPQWKCDEVTVFAPLTANRITQAVIALICPASREQKLVNEYNAACLGLIGGAKTSQQAQRKINDYKDFLRLRDEAKQRIDNDCIALGIMPD